MLKVQNNSTARAPGRFAVWRVYLEPNSIRMLFFGFSSGLPLLLVLGTLGFRLREAGVELTTIGFLSWVGLVYGFKWLWAPAVDRVALPFLSTKLGRRRSWLLASQIALCTGLVLMALTDPQATLMPLAVAALFSAFASATQDIALDAYRIESADGKRQAALAAMYQAGYRLGMIWAGAGALAFAAWAQADGVAYDPNGWRVSYLIMAASVGVGIFATLSAREPESIVQSAAPSKASACRAFSFKALAEPVTDFFRRFGSTAVPVLLLIATYRIADILMGVMANPFYADIGFTKAEVAGITKVFGVLMTLTGAFVGGAATMKFGVMKTLMCGALLSSLTNFLFSVLAEIGPSVWFLAVTVSADNLASGLSAAAFLAYLSGLTCRSYTATQYALFSSLMLMLPKFLAGFSGLMVQSLGYSNFFSVTALIGLPVFSLAWYVSRLGVKRIEELERN
ncbi:MFS transporter [Sutterella massiliensis]|uniref:MFS transporter n=1 Tax=Sutterella massiliensis TaxID=1816689 RepID=A0ABS2DNY2_9BURK|nr:MFS transporter [Sutterella massiliensis]MBM6703069.1 MFS transporter [Sutterella massiliensis]